MGLTCMVHALESQFCFCKLHHGNVALKIRLMANHVLCAPGEHVMCLLL